VNVESETGERGSQDVSPRSSPRLVENGIMSATLSTIYPPLVSPYLSSCRLCRPLLLVYAGGLGLRLDTAATRGFHAMSEPNG
jgi:hypothetical protein